MSHYGIVKRQRYWIIPEWKPYGVDHYHTKNKIIKYESISDEYYYCLNNIVVESTRKDKTVTYWEGEIQQPIVLVGERIEINNEKMEVLSIDKNIDGKVTYFVEEYHTKSPQYDELLEECNILYDKHSAYLRNKKTKKKLNESWIKVMLRNLFLNND